MTPKTENVKANRLSVGAVRICRKVFPKVFPVFPLLLVPLTRARKEKNIGAEGTGGTHQGKPSWTKGLNFQRRKDLRTPPGMLTLKNSKPRTKAADINVSRAREQARVRVGED